MRKEGELAPGLSIRIEELVTEDKSAISIGSGTLAVYSTPSLIAFMERASMMCVQSYLNEDQTTVGGAVNIKHVKPTALGQKVVCQSKIKEIKGNKIDFDVEVYEGDNLIGVGVHTRIVINSLSFMERLNS